jgi:hypothetical protein
MIYKITCAKLGHLVVPSKRGGHSDLESRSWGICCLQNDSPPITENPMKMWITKSIGFQTNYGWWWTNFLQKQLEKTSHI